MFNYLKKLFNKKKKLGGRTESYWQPRYNSYIETTNDYNILINGVNRYLNFYNQSGESGYGFRDNGGTLQYKDSGGSWSDVSASMGDLSDVDLTNIADNKILKYNSTSGDFEIADDQDTTYTSSDFDHGDLQGLGDDDHTQYLLADGSRNINNKVDFNSEYDIGTVSSNTTIDWSNGQNQKITLGADITLSFSNMGVGHKQLKVVQDATGGRTPTLPSGLWPDGTAGSFSTSANAIDILNIYWDGSSYYYQLSTGWA
jgi:hypothetical protein